MTFAAFLHGIAGAFVVYYAIYRETVFVSFIKHPRQEWKGLIFDLAIYLLCGGLVAGFIAAPGKEAFFAGGTWQGVLGGALVGYELRAKELVKKGLSEEPR